MALAAATRERSGRGPVITWSPKVFVPLTRLCRDRCHYCTFATDPASLRRAGEGLFLTPEEVVSIARAGASAGCREALFTLGDRPEARWPAARAWLEERGYDTTLDYLRAMAILVLEETGLLPHLNPGVLSWQELATLRPVAASMGLMLESASPRLLTAGMVHHGSPDKDPAVRLQTLTDAGRQRIPMTSGVLFGIGEDLGERAEALLALREVGLAHGGLQEVIVQNFRAKPSTALATSADLPHEEHLAAIAVARLILGPRMIVQAPPNLSAPAELPGLIAAGIDDWGGVSPVTPDHVNPERPWPAPEALAEATRAAGFALRARLAVHPVYVTTPGWLDPMIAAHVHAIAGSDGLADPTRAPVGRPWQTPIQEHTNPGQVSVGHPSLLPGQAGPQADPVTVTSPIRDQFRAAGTEAAYVHTAAPAGTLRAEHVDLRETSSGHRIDPDTAAALHLAATRPAALLDPAHEDAAVTLLGADGPALAELRRLADAARREAVGDEVTYVVNRNINFSTVCYTGCRFCAFAHRESDPGALRLSLADVAERTREAVSAGATEICMQGGIDPKLPATWYFQLAETIRDAAPGIHLHAFSPMEISSGAARSGMTVRAWLREARDAGVDTIPGTAAEILDDEIRWVLTRGKLPASAWVEVVTTAHSLGIRSTATMMYGHVDTAIHWVRHLRVIAGIQRATGGFTEFVPLPFVHVNAPIYLAGRARPGATPREDLAVHAFARLALHGLFDHIQGSWVKLGDEGVRAVLDSGVDDLGGTLMEESISRLAGSQHGSSRTPEQLRAMASGVGRHAVQRTTLYGRVLDSYQNSLPVRLDSPGLAPL